MRRSLSPVLALALLAAACSEDKQPITPSYNDAAVTNKDATTTSTPTDGSVGPDGGDLADSGGNGGTDVGPVVDTGVVTTMDGGPLGPNCTELEACCGSLPLGQDMCLMNAANGDEARCQMLIQQAQGGGLCLPPGFDAGPRPDANSNLTPECAALEPCCSAAGALATICNNLVQGNDPARCQQIIDVLAGRGIMCAAPADAGAPPTPDAGEQPVCQCDITTACDQNCVCDLDCIGDAGTSTTGDAGP